MFQTLYDSPWHHPTVAWAAALLAPSLALWAGRRRWLGLLVLFEAAIALDAWLTGGWTPLAPGSPWAERAAVVFVVLGDWRFFFLAERQWSGRARAAAVSLLFSLAVPLVAFACKLGWPRVAADAHLLFLIYELAFLGAALAMAQRARGRLAPGPLMRWVSALCAFQLLQYAGWALADVLILGGHDAGYGLRIAPNVLYYALFAPFAVWTAPAEARA